MNSDVRILSHVDSNEIIPYDIEIIFYIDFL